MTNILTKVQAIYAKYKWIMAFISFIFVAIITSIFVSSRPSQDQNINPEPSYTKPTNNPPITNTNEGLKLNENFESLENISNADEKEILPDNTIKYSFNSDNKKRPNLFIVQNETGPILFERFIFNSSLPTKISSFTRSFGSAPWVFKGSSFYGLEAQTYIYPAIGIAFIANPETEEVYEQHLFAPMPVEEYLRKYGDDIPAIPEP